MIAMRWACLAVFLLGLAGCGEYDPSKDPAAAPARQAQVEKIEKLKQESAAAAKPANRRPAGRR